MSDAGGRPEPDLPYGLTYDQLLAITHAIRIHRVAAEALKHTKGEEHAHESGHSADMLEFQFSEIPRYWDRLVDEERKALEREERQRESRRC